MKQKFLAIFLFEKILPVYCRVRYREKIAVCQAAAVVGGKVAGLKSCGLAKPLP